MGRKPLSKDESSIPFVIKMPVSWAKRVKALKLQNKIREAIKKILEESKS